MKNDMYEKLAPYYDVLNDNAGIDECCNFVENQIKKHSRKTAKEMLDVGCGTGRMTVEMASRGYDMVGMDLNTEMLACAYQNETKRFGKTGAVLWTQQSMTGFELYGTVDAAYSFYDCFNHLSDTKELKDTLNMLHNYIIPDGLLIFDVNTPYKFETIYANNAYILESDGVLCAWQNCYQKKKGICRFLISLFSQQGDGVYSRQDCCQSERCFSMKTLQHLMKNTGFEILEIAASINGEPITDKSLRWYFTVRCIKEQGVTT